MVAASVKDRFDLILNAGCPHKFICARHKTEMTFRTLQIVGYVPPIEEDLKTEYYGNNIIMREGYDYYRTPRCQYPTSVNKVLFTSLDKLAAFDAFAFLDTVSPRPILLIVGSKADTTYFSEAAYAKAQEPKEIFTIDGASHIDLYDKPQFVSQAITKLSEYFSRYLKTA